METSTLMKDAAGSCDIGNSYQTTQLHTSEAIDINPLNAELNPICHLLALLGAHHILHISRMRVNKTICSHNKNTELPNFYIKVFEKLIFLFYCFIMHFNSLNVTHQLMHFQYNNTHILVQNVNFKTLKNTPTCFNLNRSSSGSSSVPR